jgi:hypothetical protein|tara:strand:+ start:234 stop:464 length:231 start_codon:yes stop_codon:yes gene_type:complete
LKILFEDEFEEYLFGRWAEYRETLIQADEELDLFEFEDKHKEQILAFYKLSLINLEKSKSDYQKWLSKLNSKRILH